MGYQLWTSNLTGYRRQGTRFAEIRTLFETGIMSRSIIEPLKCLSTDSNAREARDLLKRLDFDVAGIKESQESEVMGFIYREEIESDSLEDHKYEITKEHLISDSTPLVDIFRVLRKRPFVFTLHGDRVQGIITRADINKPPVRIYLFGLISLLEMHFNYWINEYYEKDSWKKSLKKERIEGASKLLKLRQEKNQNSSLLDCLQICDKRVLVLKSERIYDIFKSSSKTKTEKLIKNVEGLRDSLAHSQNDITDGFTSWEELVLVVEYLELTLEKSDQLVEAKSIQQSENL